MSKHGRIQRIVVSKWELLDVRRNWAIPLSIVREENTLAEEDAAGSLPNSITPGTTEVKQHIRGSLPVNTDTPAESDDSRSKVTS